MIDCSLPVPLSFAETYAAQDATRRDAMEVHAEAARLVQEVDAALAKAGKQLEKEEKKQVKADSNALRKLLSKKSEKLEEADIAAIRSAKDQLEQSSAHVRSLGE